MMNPGGSIKDRVAAQMIADFEERGLDCRTMASWKALRERIRIGLAHLRSQRHTPNHRHAENMSKERQDLMKAYGAQLVLTRQV
jgi:cysteine synthase A